MNRRALTVIFLLALGVLLLLPLGLLAGGVSLSVADVLKSFVAGEDSTTRFIVIESRLPALLTAVLAGTALSVSGLIMQTCFSNPLAGPSIMGISSGSSLGVALVIMCFGGTLGTLGNLAIAGGAFIGAVAVLMVILVLSGFVRSSYSLLIVGILVGYLTSSAISLLNFFSTDSAVHSFVVWGLGTFSGVSLEVVPLLGGLVAVLTVASFFYYRSLDALEFGNDFAAITGVSVGRVRTGLILLSGALTAVATAWCGPIAFIGMVVPHVARMLTGGGSHLVLIPATALSGALVGLACQILSVLPSMSHGSAVPVNAITPVFGVPLILYVLLRRMKTFGYAE